MEEYIGANLIITTPKGKITGTLQEIDPGMRKLRLDASGVVKVVDVCDIEEVEIVPEEEAEILSRSLIEKTSRPLEQPAGQENRDLEEKEAKKRELLEREVRERETKDREARDRAARERTGREQKDAKYAPITQNTYVTSEVYREIVLCSDYFWGPSREELVYASARSALHLSINALNLQGRKIVCYIGTGIFSEIGVVLARLLSLYSLEVTLVVPNETAKTSKEILYYQNVGGKRGTRRTDQSVAIIADTVCNESMTRGIERIIYLGEYQNVSGPLQEVIYFGYPVQNPLNFTGTSILCDIGLSPSVYKRFNLARYPPKILQKIQHG